MVDYRYSQIHPDDFFPDDNDESTTDGDISTIKTKVNFGAIKLQLKAISQERLNMVIDQKMCFVTNELNMESCTDDVENAKDRGTEKEATTPPTKVKGTCC